MTNAQYIERWLDNPNDAHTKSVGSMTVVANPAGGTFLVHHKTRIASLSKGELKVWFVKNGKMTVSTRRLVKIVQNLATERGMSFSITEENLS